MVANINSKVPTVMFIEMCRLSKVFHAKYITKSMHTKKVIQIFGSCK